MIRLPRCLEFATWRAPWLSASLTLAAFVIDRFQWDLAMRRDAVLRGELFRLVTGHFCHFNRAHLLGDALAFAVWAACAEQRGRGFLASTLMVTTLGSSLLLLAFYPGVVEYRGLSAIDCALAAQLIACGVVDRRRARDVAGAALFASAGLAFMAKTSFEFHTGHAVLAPDLGDSVALLPASHAAGIALGLACLAGAGTRLRYRARFRLSTSARAMCHPNLSRNSVRMGNSTMFPFDSGETAKRLTIDRRIAS